MRTHKGVAQYRGVSRSRVERIAREAFRQGRTTREVAAMSDLGWKELKRQSCAPEATVVECAAAVDLLAQLRVEDDYRAP